MNIAYRKGEDNYGENGINHNHNTSAGRNA